MRIAFLTSGLEPGRDGVGDYVRTFAAHATRLGHPSSLLALNDALVADTRETQAERGTAVPTLRLPAQVPWSRRVTRAREWLVEQGADWVSVHLVPYGFQAKGVAAGLGARLRAIVPPRRRHLMLHELWIGSEVGATLRDRLVGSLQRRALLAAVRQLAPEHVHTSNASYRALLAREGIEAGLLPLFGNVPFAGSIDPHWLSRELAAHGVPAALAADRAGSWRFGLFGSLHPGWASGALFEQLARAAARAGRRVVVCAIGRAGPGAQEWPAIAARHARHAEFALLGERDWTQVSTFLQSVDFGITSTPWRLLGKSGTVAAMFEHGLRVVVPRDDLRHVGVDVELREPRAHRVDASLADWLAAPAPARVASVGAEHTVARLLRELEARAGDASVPV